MGAGIFKGVEKNAGHVGKIETRAEKTLLEYLPPNRGFKPGDRVKFTDRLIGPVSKWRTMEYGTILEGTRENAFYSIKTPGQNVYHDVPYFLLCPADEDLFFDDFVRVGTRMMFRRSPREEFDMGTVTSVHYTPVARYNACLDVRGDDGRTSFNLPPLNYRFPLSYYTEIIGRYQRYGNDIITSRADFFNEVVDDGVKYVADELLFKFNRTTENEFLFDTSFLPSRWKEDFGMDLGVPSDVLDALDDDKFVEKVLCHMGTNFQARKKIYDDDSFTYIIRK